MAYYELCSKFCTRHIKIITIIIQIKVILKFSFSYGFVTKTSFGCSENPVYGKPSKYWTFLLIIVNTYQLTNQPAFCFGRSHQTYIPCSLFPNVLSLWINHLIFVEKILADFAIIFAAPLHLSISTQHTNTTALFFILFLILPSTAPKSTGYLLPFLRIMQRFTRF